MYGCETSLDVPSERTINWIEGSDGPRESSLNSDKKINSERNIMTVISFTSCLSIVDLVRFPSFKIYLGNQLESENPY